MLAALFAGRAGSPVTLLETRPKPGAKIRVSGGGRCNILPSEMQLDDFHTSGSPHRLRNVLFSWPLPEVRRFFEADLGIALKQESTGKLFPVSERPQDVVVALLAALARGGVRLECGFRAVAIRPAGESPGFEITAADGRRIAAQRLVLATGGLSLPKTGSDGHGLEMARSLGIPIEPTYPALVPLRVGDSRWHELAGISVPARLAALRGGKCIEERERELLFTHRGLSGPVVLDMSRHVAAPHGNHIALQVRWGGGDAPDWEHELRPAGKQRLATTLRSYFPDRLADFFLMLAAIPAERRQSDATRDERARLVEVLVRCPLPVTGNEGYATAEVTAGGVGLDAVHPKTLESRAVPGLYFCGEMLDAVGRIGGYNFLWAWVTGRKAGEAAAAALTP
jgi:hypothetical protein